MSVVISVTSVVISEHKVSYVIYATTDVFLLTNIFT